jgi:serine/threonine protein kinase
MVPMPKACGGWAGGCRWGDALYIVLRCAAALHCAHEQHQVIHRDVKLTNVLLNNLGYVKLTDLGLAKALTEDLSLTESGTGVGTPDYMAPEQMRNAKHADHRSDLYSLGVVVYRLLTGNLPFQAESTGEMLLAKEAGRFPSARRQNAEVPPRLDLILDRMLARDMCYRYQTYGELIRDLESLGVANPHLGFNLLRLALPSGESEVLEDRCRVEVLLIDDDASGVLSAQEALDQSGDSTNLSVVPRLCEAQAFLNRHGEYSAAPRPNLIIFGHKVVHPGDLATIAALKAREDCHKIPFVVLSNSAGPAEAAEILRGLGKKLQVRQLADLKHVKEVLRSTNLGSTINFVQLPRR